MKKGTFIINMMVFVLFCITLTVNTAYSSSDTLKNVIKALKNSKEFLGDTSADGIFSLGMLNNTLYAGAYTSDGFGTQMIYRLSENSLDPVIPGITDIQESVCKFIEFKEDLYINTEGLYGAKIYRSKNGSKWDTVWNNRTYNTGCGLAVFEGELYATATGGHHPGGIIVRSSLGNNWEKEPVYKDEGGEKNYIKEIVAYNDKIYAFMSSKENRKNEKAYYKYSKDGEQWSGRIPMKHRILRALHSPIDNNLWLVTSKRHTDKVNTGKSVILKMQPGQEPKDDKYFPELYSTDRLHVGNITSASSGHLFAVVPNGCCGKIDNNWVDSEGDKQGVILLMSDDRGINWEQIDNSLGARESWGVKVIGKYLYVGTSGGVKSDSKTGLYRYDISELVKLKINKSSALPATYNMIHKNQK